MQLEQKTHAVQLRKREEELAAREMNLLEREISVIIQVILYVSTATRTERQRDILRSNKCD